MTTDVYYDDDTDWEKLMHKMCICGHELYMHAFTDHVAYRITSDQPSGSRVLWTSQCIRCPYDEKGQRFTCEGFKSKE